MIDWQSRILLSVLTVVTLLAGWALLAVSQTLAAYFSLTVFLIAHLLLLIDTLDLMLRLYFRQLHSGTATGTQANPRSVPLSVGDLSPYQKRAHLQGYAIVVAIHEAEAELDEFVEGMHAFRDRLWVIDDGSKDHTARRLRQANIRCLENGDNRRKPAALRHLLESLPLEIQTVLVLDPDSRILDSGGSHLSDLDAAVFDFQRSGMAAASPRVTVRDGGWWGRLQRFEYWLSFAVGRKSLGDRTITPGVALYRRDALQKALDQHSLSVYAEDLENAFILLSAGERIYYDGRLVIETEAKTSLRSWFSQRVGWSYGFLRAYTLRFKEVRLLARGRLMATYQYLVYMGLISLALHPIRVVGFTLLLLSLGNGLDNLFEVGWIPDGKLTEPAHFSTVYLSYTVLAAIALLLAVGPGERWRLLPAIPFFFFYALLRVLAATVGYGNWVSLRWWGRRLFKDHYQDEASLVREHALRRQQQRTT